MKSKIKPMATAERVRLSDVVPLDTPFTVYIYPTTFCNFRCTYCGHSLGKETMKEVYDLDFETMEMDTFKLIIDLLKAFPRKLKVLSLTGHGEPLINENLSDMVRYAKENNISEKIEFISNGSLLTNEVSNNLIDAGLDCLKLSIQGVTAKSYKKVCNYNIDYEEFIKQVEYFYNNRKNCQLYVKTMDIALSENERELFYKTYENISDRMYIEEVRNVYSGVSSTENINVTKDRYGRTHEKRHVCPLCFFGLGILPNGDVKPCDSVYKPIILGNVRDSSLIDMWNGKILKEFRRTQLKGERYSNEKCKVCIAPDDVSHPLDELDAKAQEILKKL
ncbi:MAG: radical SAM protein [Acetobacterium woodii]|nr:radical SAM protein [Acetobacterium woodii]